MMKKRFEYFNQRGRMKFKEMLGQWRDARSKHPKLTVDQFRKCYLDSLNEAEYPGNMDEQIFGRSIKISLSGVALKYVKAVLMQEAGLS